MFVEHRGFLKKRLRLCSECDTIFKSEEKEFPFCKVENEHPHRRRANTGGFYMSTIGMVLTGILMVIAILLSVIILLQSKRSAGLGAVSGTSNSDSYWSKNKSNSMEGALEKYTKIGGALFMIIAFIINLVG